MKATFERILLQLGILIGGGGFIALLVALITQAAFDKSIGLVTRTEVKCEVSWKGPAGKSGADIIGCDELPGWKSTHARADYRMDEVELAEIAFARATGETHYVTVRLADLEATGAKAGDEITLLFHNDSPDQVRGALSWTTLLKFFTVILLGGAILFADGIMRQVEAAAARMPAPRPTAKTTGGVAGNRHRAARRA